MTERALGAGGIGVYQEECLRSRHANANPAIHIRPNFAHRGFQFYPTLVGMGAPFRLRSGSDHSRHAQNR